MTTIPQRILVPTDFSSSANGALSLAVRLARRIGAELHVLHVRVLLEAPYLASEQQRQIEKLLASCDERAHAQLHRDGDEDTQKTSVLTHVVRGVSAPEAIVETCSELGCSLIVMGTHGRRGLKHLLLGSVAEAVVRTSSVAVLTVHPRPQPRPTEIDQILVPHDFSDHSRAAVDVAADWSRALDARVTLLHVIEPVVYPEFYAVDLMPDETMLRLRDRSRAALEQIALEAFGGHVDDCLVASGSAGETIVRIAEERGAALVVMGSRGLTGLEHLLLGSVAEAVLRRCPTPLLTVN